MITVIIQNIKRFEYQKTCLYPVATMRHIRKTHIQEGAIQKKIWLMLKCILISRYQTLVFIFVPAVKRVEKKKDIIIAMPEEQGFS